MSDYPVELENIAKQFGITGDEMLRQIAAGELVVTRAIDIDNGEEDVLPPGISWDELIALIEELDFSPEDVAEMSKAIQEGRHIDHAGW